jgi:hypothetical protein
MDDSDIERLLSSSEMDEDRDLLRRLCQEATTRFDAVQICATRYDADQNNQTRYCAEGLGNYHARLGIVQEWLWISEDQIKRQTRA